LATLVARLAEGRIAAAEVALDAVAKTDGDADAARRRIGRVRGVLEKRADALLAEAEVHVTDGRLDDAYRAAAAANALQPDYAPPRIALARIRFAQKDFEAAGAWIGPLAQRGDAPAEAHYWLGKVLAAKGADAAAKDALEECVRRT